LLNIAKL